VHLHPLYPFDYACDFNVTRCQWYRLFRVRVNNLLHLSGGSQGICPRGKFKGGCEMSESCTHRHVPIKNRCSLSTTSWPCVAVNIVVVTRSRLTGSSPALRSSVCNDRPTTHSVAGRQHGDILFPGGLAWLRWWWQGDASHYATMRWDEMQGALHVDRLWRDERVQ